MANDIGNIKSIKGTSIALNGQAGVGGQKPSASGKDDPGGTRPEKVPDEPVAVAK